MGLGSMKAAIYNPPTTPSIRAAIYGRVSTIKQDYALQQHEVNAYVGRMGWEAAEYLEQASSRVGSKRIQLERLLEDARLRRFDVVVVWKMDRFARSLTQLISNLQLLAQHGVRFISVTDRIDTDDKSPTGRLLLQILGAFAEFERNIIVERVKAGVDEAKRQGKHCGRPARVFDREHAAQLRSQGMSWRAIGRAVGIPFQTVKVAVLGVQKASAAAAKPSRRNKGLSKA